MLINLLLAAGAVAAVPKRGFVIVEKGVAKTAIVLPAGARPQDRRAADILQASVEKMSGATLPIRTDAPATGGNIVIGIRPSQTMPADGFRTTVTAGGIAIEGGDHKGTIYAVVDLLERQFGCRYFSPTAQLFPKKSTLTVPLGVTADAPVNTFRAINGDFDADPDWMDWNRLSSTDEMFGRGYYVHTFHRLVPPETYFHDHPELFAMVNGKRQPDQLCPSQPENVEIAVQTLKREMAAQPDKQVWSVSQNDNETYCHCPLCMKAMEEDGSPSGPILRFVNAVAKHFPDKTISTLAYLYSRPAPKVTKPDSNVQIMLCTIELDRGLPIATDPGSAAFRKDIVNWGKICKNIYLWDYTVDFAHQVSPFPNLPVLQPNLQFFVQNNARQQFQQTNTSPGHEFSELKSYLIAKLLWNPNANVQATESDFLKGYYGPAAPFIGEYIEAIQGNLLRSGTRLDIYEPPTAHANDFLSARDVDAYDRLFDDAEAHAAHDPVILQRVKVARLPLEYAKIVIGSDSMFGPRGFFEDRNGVPTLRRSMSDTLEDFNATCAANHVRSVNESNLKPADFYHVIKGMLDLQIDGNLAFRKPVTADPPPSPKYGHGDVSLLTNGIRGSNDFRIQWLGWEGVDCDLTVDLGKTTNAHEAAIDSLYIPSSWLIHPAAVECSVSTDGVTYQKVGEQIVGAEQRTEPLIKTFTFDWTIPNVRYVRLHVQGAHTLPSWHTAAGNKAWFFLDELSVR